MLSTGVFTVDYKMATDELLDRIDLSDLAAAMGVSESAVRQARLSKDNPGYREPPKGWEHAVSRLAKERVEHYRMLVKKLDVRE